MKDQVRDLILSAGDMIQGLPMNNQDKGATMANIANQIGYTAIAIGNHEFDYGLDTILEREKENTQKGTPFLSANVV
ncbi:UNVERIFIED_CONTAM: hypothetical protein O8I53_11365 [Campylobacter lari]